MWRKDDEQATTTGPVAATRQAARSSTAETSGRAVIGPSIRIKGDVTGSEDLLIEGEIDGSVTLGDHAVGVGSEGRVNADIVGRVITVDGEVEGNLQAREQIVLRGTAKVKGDIKAPRVVLEDGATFRGLVDMGSPPASREGTDKAVTKRAGSDDAGAGANGASAAGPTESDPSDSGSKSGVGKSTSGGRAAAASSK